MGPVMISHEDFRRLISERSSGLLRAADFMETFYKNRHEIIMTRPLLGDLLSHASQLEELLDAYGARNNSTWSRYRSLTAGIKLFSNVGYELLHIMHALPAYRLMDVEQDFRRETQNILEIVQHTLFNATKRLTDEALELKLTEPDAITDSTFYSEVLPPGRLPHDLSRKKIEKVSKSVTLLATAFLNLAAESKKILPHGQVELDAILCEMTGPVSEEKLRSMELRFHNLQSLYDSYVSTTETEVLDKDLSILRGHISVVLHLLRTAKDLAHYYERHAGPDAKRPLTSKKRLIESDKLLRLLLNYSINFVSQFLYRAEILCQNMLKRYTEIDEAEVLVPQYRGFHVRPSTLISKLVLHYGSQVTMMLGDETYDASSPLELFRANEKINAQKRRAIAKEIYRLDLVSKDLEDMEIESVIRKVVLTLAEKSKMIIYEQPLQIEKKNFSHDSKVIEQITDEIARLQVTGKIDIATNTKVQFIGDKRVLADIQLLAENGYGEDNFGNNIALPEGLTYLRK